MPAEPLYEALAPTGRVIQDSVTVNQRPTDLTGKRVGFVWDNLFKGPVFFAAIRKQIDKQFSGVSFVDHDQFGDIHGFDSRRVFDELPAKIREARLDVAIVAVGA